MVWPCFSHHSFEPSFLLFMLIEFSFLDQALGHIYVQLGQTEKALELLRKAAKVDPRDAQVRKFN